MQPHTQTDALGDSLETSLTVADLAQAPDLHLEVVAGHAGLSRVIEAVYIGDLDDPTPWMVQGSFVLTTGPRIEQDPDSGAELVRLLRRSGMVGVGVAIKPNVLVIPDVMLKAGDDEGLPVLRVPEETPFRRVTSYFFNALASRDMHRLRRSVAMQQYLVEALLDERRVDALVRRLAEITWRLARITNLEGRAIEKAIETGDTECKFLNNFSIYTQRLNRDFQSTLKTLHTEQAARLERHNRAWRVAVILYDHHKRKNLPWDPAADGFVFSNEQLARQLAFNKQFDRAMDKVYIYKTTKELDEWFANEAR